MTDARPDHAQVIAPPPLIWLADLVLGALLDWLAPLGLLAALPLLLRIALGVIPLVAGIFIWFDGIREFRRTSTNLNPYEPTVAVIRSGIFGRMRNPIYVGGMLGLLGVAILLALDWVAVLWVPAVLLLHYGVVLREEAYLEGKFGDEYRRYQAEVPRYGWRV